MIRRVHLEELKERILAIERHLNKVERFEDIREQAVLNPIPTNVSLIVKRYFELPPTEKELLLNVVCDSEEKKEQIRSYAKTYEVNLIADNLRKEIDLLNNEINFLIADAKNLRSAVNEHRATKPVTSSLTEDEERPKGTLIPQSILTSTLLEVLADMGGRGEAKMILEEMECRLGDRLTDADKELLKDNEPRWRKKTQWLRIRLKEKGLLKADSPRGLWELSQ